MVEADFPSRNSGTAKQLTADRSPLRETDMKFAVAGLPGAVQSAKLRVYVRNGSEDGPAVYGTVTSWTEGTVTWNTRPARTTSALDDRGAVGSGWLEYDVTRAVTANGTYSFSLVSTSTDGTYVSSREGGSAPQLSVVTGDGGSDPPPPPPTTYGPITATVETTPVPNTGDAADDAAIWVHPTDTGSSTIIGTDKLGGLAVYDLAGRQLFYYADGRPNNVDLRYNVRLSGSPTTIVAASNRADNTLRLYKVDPATRGLVNVASRAIAPGIVPYGLCMYHSATTGGFYVFVNDSYGVTQQWELFDAGNGRMDLRKVREFDVGTQTEGCVADDETGALYIGEEAVGIWRYSAEAGGGSIRTRVDSVGGGHLTADVEGLTIYYAAGGGGYLLASSQGNSTFAIYDRRTPNAYLRSFSVVGGSIDAVTGTDGIDVLGFPLGSAFPQGVFVAQDNTDNSGRQNFKLVPWNSIAMGANPFLTVDTSWDPRAVGR